MFSIGFAVKIQDDKFSSSKFTPLGGISYHSKYMYILASGVQRAIGYKQTADKEKNVYKNSRTPS